MCFDAKLLFRKFSRSRTHGFAIKVTRNELGNAFLQGQNIIGLQSIPVWPFRILSELRRDSVPTTGSPVACASAYAKPCVSTVPSSASTPAKTNRFEL